MRGYQMELVLGDIRLQESPSLLQQALPCPPTLSPSSSRPLPLSTPTSPLPTVLWLMLIFHLLKNWKILMGRLGKARLGVGRDWG